MEQVPRLPALTYAEPALESHNSPNSAGCSSWVQRSRYGYPPVGLWCTALPTCPQPPHCGTWAEGHPL